MIDKILVTVTKTVTKQLLTHDQYNKINHKQRSKDIKFYEEEGSRRGGKIAGIRRKSRGRNSVQKIIIPNLKNPHKKGSWTSLGLLLIITLTINVVLSDFSIYSEQMIDERQIHSYIDYRKRKRDLELQIPMSWHFSLFLSRPLIVKPIFVCNISTQLDFYLGFIQCVSFHLYL